MAKACTLRPSARSRSTKKLCVRSAVLPLPLQRRLADQVVGADRYQDAPDDAVVHNLGCHLEAEVEVFFVLSPLFDAAHLGRREGWSRTVQVSCFADRRSVLAVSLMAPIDSHPQHPSRKHPRAKLVLLLLLRRSVLA
eukprot:CAMPEP_0119060260 /NCGR_PEP_ID=MMETSP1178-20130426/4263_1 /TAXON_ID=33656 /ORGANISM="unid sp, Strain CCMP2000" /LENGTH=137 /DNA_ID=CAMNT_0007041351 /DNA_START=133 /DNA_END=542 /DNA_ORIENTATION=-